MELKYLAATKDGLKYKGKLVDFIPTVRTIAWTPFYFHQTEGEVTLKRAKELKAEQDPKKPRLKALKLWLVYIMEFNEFAYLLESGGFVLNRVQLDIGCCYEATCKTITAANYTWGAFEFKRIDLNLGITIPDEVIEIWEDKISWIDS